MPLGPHDIIMICKPDKHPCEWCLDSADFQCKCGKFFCEEHYMLHRDIELEHLDKVA